MAWSAGTSGNAWNESTRHETTGGKGQRYNPWGEDGWQGSNAVWTSQNSWEQHRGKGKVTADGNKTKEKRRKKGQKR